MPDPISWEFAWPYYLMALGLGYLFGSIPFGLLLTRWAGLGDIRKIGSGNIGMTNVLRTGRKDLAALTLLGDALKGVAAVLIVQVLWGQGLTTTAGLGAFLGHLFPVWLKFKGGKGVATFLGVIFALYWPAGLSFIAIWLAMAYLFRYSSLSALTASLATTLLLFFAFDYARVAEAAAMLTLLLWLMHRENIARLLSGKESKIGHKA